jgi:hypothetical protein
MTPDHDRARRPAEGQSAPAAPRREGAGATEYNPVWQFLATHPFAPQRKPVVNQRGDAYEREADRVADQVLRTPESDIAAREPPRAPGSPSGLESMPGGGRPLPGPVRTFFEPRLGRDLSAVRLHTGPDASEVAHALNAKAFTARQHIVFGAGQFAPATTEGKRLLGHELTHVVQQSSADREGPAPGAAVSPVLRAHPGTLQRQPTGSDADASQAEEPPIFETREDPERGETVQEEIPAALPAEPLADALPLRAALGDARWQQLEAAATRRESLRRHQQVSYPEGSTMVDATVDEVLAPATYVDPGDVAQVWAALKGDAVPSESDQELMRDWATATTISGYRASVADLSAMVLLADPDALEGGPSRLTLLLPDGAEVPLDQGLIELSALGDVASPSLTARGEQAAADALTMLKAKTLIVQGTAQLTAVRELAAACETDSGEAVVASLEQARAQADVIATGAGMLGAAAGPSLTAIRAELETARAAAAADSLRVALVIDAVRNFQFKMTGGSGRSLDEFWRRADDVPVVGTVFSFFSAGDSRYRAQHLQALQDGTISYNHFDAEMNGWKEYLSAGVNMAMTFTAAKLAGPGATAIFGIDATWSPIVASATRNVFASFATSIGKDVAIALARATTSDPGIRQFLQSQIATPTDALLGAAPGVAMDVAIIRITRPGPAGPAAPIAPEGEGGAGPPTTTRPPTAQRRALDYPEDMQLDISGNRADATKSGRGRTQGQINWRRYEDQRATQNRARAGLTDQTSVPLGRGERFEGGRTQYSVRPDLSTQGATWFEDAKMRDFSNNANVIDAAASVQKMIRAAELQGDAMSAEFSLATTRQLPPRVTREILKRVALWLRREGYNTAEMNSFLERITFSWALPK